MKPTETIEGPEAWKRFNAIVDKVISVPRSVIEQREAEYRRQSKANPNRRGPKPKNVSRDSGASLPA